MSALTLNIITQEEELLNTEVEQVTAPTSTGEITILPHHIPLLTRLETGELTYKKDGELISVVVSDGFLDVAPNSMVTVLTDSAILERDITLAQAEAAKQKAEEAMAQKIDKRQIAFAEASLKKALIELKIARKQKTIKPGLTSSIS